MADIKKIEIICVPCHKCEIVKEKIQSILSSLENINNVRLRYEFIFHTDRREAMKEVIKSGYTINELPVTLVNGEVAFTGSRISEQKIRIILETILKY